MASPGDSLGLEDALGGSGAEVPFVNNDVKVLLRRWRDEKYAPELLPFDKEVVDNICEVFEFVTETLEEDRADGANLDPNDSDHVLRCMDMERMKYVLRDYLRIRLWKLGQFPQHYLEPANIPLLSEAERAYLRDMWDLKSAYFDHRLIGALPDMKKSLNDTIDLLSMVRRPILDKHIYVRIIGDVGVVDVPPTATQDTAVSQQEPLNLAAGKKYLLRYIIIRKYLMEKEHDGKVELI